MGHIVAKFGGTSLAQSQQIKKVIKIVRSDPARIYVVVSAPGKRHPDDQKITDLFYEWQRHAALKLSSTEIRGLIEERYLEIIKGLGLSLDIKAEIDRIASEIKKGASPDYTASRGEYLNGKILAEALGYEFIDPAFCIFFQEDGRYGGDEKKLQAALKGKKAVIPGFYGSMPDGSIKTFSRGGSDITGAIVAKATRADTYENWTDVSGLRMADPRIVPNPKKIPVVTYRELRELSYMGATIFHEEAMFPVQNAKIPTHILNTNNPTDSGTLVVPDNDKSVERGSIAGIAGRKGFTTITVEKTLMNQEIGFVREVLSVVEHNDISFEHMPSGIDSISLVFDDRQLAGKTKKLVQEMRSACSPDTIEVNPNLALIAVVGRGMAYTPGVASKIFSSVSNAGINIRMINQGSSEISIIFGVHDADYDNAIRAVYKAFVRSEFAFQYNSGAQESNGRNGRNRS